ncbi:MAG: nucleotidyltransferase [Candidatus Omnitrophica bacterium]|nr:nucleotidyltransferase [Candidatus Omnitrophota bacterium]
MVSSPFTPAKVRKALRTALGAARTTGARVALTGGSALEAWGISRATQDLDLVFLLPQHRLFRLQHALQDCGARIVEVRGDPKTTWLRVLLAGVQIDWLQAWDQPTQRALRRAVARQVLGMRLKVLRPEDLILLKLRVGRPRDLDDAARLYTACAGQLDQRYLTHAARQLRLGKEWAYLVQALRQLEG